MGLTGLERITAVETRLSTIEERMDRIETKLDALLELKNKGAGAFWFVSIIFGTGVLGALAGVLHWFRS